MALARHTKRKVRKGRKGKDKEGAIEDVNMVLKPRR